jgi:hypothetical protein
MVEGATRAIAGMAMRRAAKLCRFFRILRHRNRASPMFLGDLSHVTRLFIGRRRMAVTLQEQNCLAIGWETDLAIVLNTTNRCAIEKLHRAGDDLCGNDGRDRSGSCVHLFVNGQQGLSGRRFRDKFKQDLCDYTERSLLEGTGGILK